MTTWPGFGDGTFHYPEKKDDPKKQRKVIARGSFYLPKTPHALQGQDAAEFPIPVFQVCQLCHVMNVSPDGVPKCLQCGCKWFAKTIHPKTQTDAPEVTGAMKIMYPEE